MLLALLRDSPGGVQETIWEIGDQTLVSQYKASALPVLLLFY